MMSSNTLRCAAPLFVPADRPERFVKAAASAADAVILDLEDAVAPEAKSRARHALRADFTEKPVLVRVNGLGTPWHLDDMAAVSALPVAGLIIPKATAAGMAQVARGICAGKSLIALIETAQGLAEARDIARMPAVERLAFGSIDYCLDLDCHPTRDSLQAARAEIVLASRLGNLIAPLDGVTANLRDAGAAADDARHARAIGFGGKLCIHPAQVAGVRYAFAPTPEEIAWARRVVACEDGAGSLDGMIVDAPVVARARRLLEIAKSVASTDRAVIDGA